MRRAPLPSRPLATLIVLLALAGAATGTAVTRPPFEDAAGAEGLSFRHDNGMRGGLHLPEIMGPGAALADFDNDGDLDVFLVQGGALDDRGRPIAGSARHRLFRSDLLPLADGRRRPHFIDVSDAFGLGAAGYGMGVATGDVDNDGWTDVFLAQYGTDRLLRNEGGRRLVDVSDRLGPPDPGWSVSATFFDFDRDGWLDLFVARYVDYEPVPCFLASTRRDYCGPRSYRPQRARLLRNRGLGVFEDVTGRMLGPHRPAPGLGVVAADLDQDGWLDLYVANDGANNHLWRNRQGRGFEEAGLLAGVAVNRLGLPEASMGVDAGDVDEDGDLDLFVTNLTGETNTLYVNLGGGLFDDRSVPSGLAVPSLPFTGFGTAFLDFDGDGRLDVVTVNGAVHFAEGRPPTASEPLPLEQSKQLFSNAGGGRFEDLASRRGPAFAREEVSRGLAVGDIDEDGDPDLLVANTNGPPRLLLDVVGQDQPWAGVRLVDGKRDALGALAQLRREGAPHLWRRVHTDGSYASASDPRVLFGLGAGGRLLGLEVRWAGGSVEQFAPPVPGRYTTVRRGEGRPARQQKP